MLTNYTDIINIKQMRNTLGYIRIFVYELIGECEIPALQVGLGNKITKLSVVQCLLAHKNYSELNQAKELLYFKRENEILHLMWQYK